MAVPINRFGANAQPNFPARNGLVLTKSDTVPLANTTTGIYVGGTGALNVILVGDTAATLFSAVPVGTFLPIQVQQSMSTGTTATLVVGVW